MQKSIFPKLLNADIHEHAAILYKELHDLHNQKILELGTGSGTLANILPNDNYYTVPYYKRTIRKSDKQISRKRV